jgi:hypothetical protein
MALVLALSSSAAQVSAAFVVGVRRRDHGVVLYRRCKAALIILSHSIVCVGGAPVDTDHIASLALTVGYLAGLGVFVNMPSTSVSAISQPTLPLQSVLSVSCM